MLLRPTELLSVMTHRLTITDSQTRRLADSQNTQTHRSRLCSNADRTDQFDDSDSQSQTHTITDSQTHRLTDSPTHRPTDSQQETLLGALDADRADQFDDSDSQSQTHTITDSQTHRLTDSDSPTHRPTDSQQETLLGALDADRADQFDDELDDVKTDASASLLAVFRERRLCGD